MIQFDTIFLVDDDPINNLINKRLLGKVGITDNIIEFLEAEEALSQLNDIDPNKSLLIFLDINMPVLNGWEFLNKYQEAHPNRRDKIVILSSSIDYQDRFKAQGYKIVSGFLEKPLTFEKIKTQLEKYTKE
ncbi:response regulator [Algoriphagus winogradskyi]|uniref:Response regulator receiver domain-containing protein n=1 Tax=Algoriphagus winogradskyi TaxID=237017 RepID=A0ABY1NCF5_9BACT|nr:response regulator [Algoriphagus winogradskyi]SMP06337.1 Response regulator receiver domain-containing protein [Algoriphagus winogradskyi]